MNKGFQTVFQLVFLGLFAIFIITAKAQLWMILFIGGILLSLFFGRLYCGFICPINTVTGHISRIKHRWRIKSLPIPEFFRKPPVRYFVLIIFIITLALTIISGKKLPVLPILFFLGVFLTLFLPENLWHRYLCPYGSILGIAGSKAKRYMKINSEKCIGCGLCAKVCPGNAVLNLNPASNLKIFPIKDLPNSADEPDPANFSLHFKKNLNVLAGSRLKQDGYQIDKSLCLLCFNCAWKCPDKMIHY